MTRLCTLMYAVLAVLCVCAASCSTKKNTPVSRNWQAFTTRYNVYFNGSEHYKDQLATMEKGYADDYTRMLLTHPAEARGDNKLPQPSGDFKRTIEKMQKAIQLHSIKKKPTKKSGSAKEKAFRAREEFNPFLHNAWLTMGKAQFMNGDFLGAASTFFYISKHFTWLPEVVTEARLWQARSYCALDWTYEAENILHLVKPKDLTDKTLTRLYDITQADYMVRTEQWQEAVPYLTRAAQAASGAQKNRLWFLLGQVYTQLGQKQNAYIAYKKAGSGASTDYRTKFNARIKRSEVFTGTNIRPEVNALKSMTRYERNKEYLDQIYYAIGNLYMSRGDTALAKENYALAVEKSTRDGIDKALAQLALGTIYFDEGDYVKAQPCYSEAVPRLSDNFPDYRLLRRRSEVLDELAVYAGNVELQDSLLTLAAMTPDEQREACQRLVDELIKREKEEADAAAREEFMAQQQGQNSPMNQNTPTQGFQVNTDKSWYFYNDMTKSAGKTEFQRKWGARKLEDDWRRRNKTSFSFDEPEADSQERNDSTVAPVDSVALNKANDPHNVEYYLKQIPSTPEEIQTANTVIEEGLYNMGVILKDKLEDFPAARHEFMELDRRYPDNEYRLDVYYNMYLMAVRSDNSAQAEVWRQKILTDFPDSPYGQAMKDPQYFEHLRNMYVRQENMYTEAYEAYLDNNNNTVHTLTKEMEADYPLSPILPKFVFIDALSYLTEENYDEFKERLTYLLQKWPDTDMTDMAGAIVKGLNAGRKPHAGVANSRGMLWETRLGETNETGSDGQPANFERDPNKPQYLVLAFPRDSVNANQVLFDVARFNFSSFRVKDFDLEPMSFGNIGLLIIKGFANVRELEYYREIMARSDFGLPGAVRPIMISKANFELLLREGRSFDDYFRFQAEEAVRAKEEEVLGAEQTEEPDNTDLSEGSEEAKPSELSEEAESSEESEQTEDPDSSENSEESDLPESSEDSAPSEVSEESVPSENPDLSESSEESDSPEVSAPTPTP